MILTFCGHSRLLATEEINERILYTLKTVVGNNACDIYLGGYGDFDEIAYQCCKKYKSDNPNISLVLVTPYLTEHYQKTRLEYQKDKYYFILYPEIENKPLKFAITYRNRWMVDKSDFVICAITHTYGGAYKTYLYAKRRKKQIYNVTESNFIQNFSKNNTQVYL